MEKESIMYQKKLKLVGELSIMKAEDIKPNFSALSREYAMDRHTIKKYYEEPIKAITKTKRSRRSELDKYIKIIEEKLKNPANNLIGIYKYLVHTYSIKSTYSNFKSYCKNRKLHKTTMDLKPHPRFETEPGEQLQVDWKENIVLKSRLGEIFTFNLFIATLSYSRKRFIVFSELKTEDCFIRCLCDVFAKMGAVPNVVLTDNMTAIVDTKGSRKFKHNTIIQFEKDFGIKIKLCKIRSPQTKGKVESMNRFIRRLNAYDGEFETLEELQNIINQLNTDIDFEVNPTTSMQPIVLFKKEQQYLSPLPNNILLENYLTFEKTTIVPNTMLVSYKGSGYSVPMKYINTKVKLIHIGSLLYIYQDFNVIAVHAITNKKFVYTQAHYKEALTGSIKHVSSQTIEHYAQQNLRLLDNIKTYGGSNNEN